MSFWLGVAFIAVGLIISIALHEVGHMLPAKRFGVKVPQYFVGFGKTLWSTTRGETEYGVKLLPLGGFVRMIGMYPPKRATRAAGAPTQELSPESAAEQRIRRRGLRGWAANVADDAREYSNEEVPPGQEDRAFYSLSVPKKLTVMFGGPVVNLIISAVCIAVVLCGFGVAVASNEVAEVSECVLPADAPADAACAADAEQAPAAAAGLQAGDRILSWNGEQISDWDGITAAIAAAGSEPSEVVVERDGTEQTLTVTPTMTQRPVIGEDGAIQTDDDGTPLTQEAPFVGITAATERDRLSVGEVPPVVWETFTGTVQVVVTLPARLVSIASSLTGQTERDPNVMGLIGAARVSGEVAQGSYGGQTADRLALLLSVLASLNMALFVFNLIPLPPLDGGHIAGALYEGARRKVAAWRRRPHPGFADTAKLMPVTYGVFLVLIGMSLVLAIADIVRPVGL